MSGRRRQSLSPSLFPFLAVLVCTLGTLILFLALVAQNATEAAERNARAEQVAQAKLQSVVTKPETPRLTARVVQSMLEEEQFRVAQLVAFRDNQTADMEDRRDQLTYLEDHIERVRQKLKQLSDEVDQAMGDTTVEAIEDDAIADLRQKVMAERANVEKLRLESEKKTPRVVIVPHKGPNGTDRRPVYLECTDQGVTIWPEGSQLTITQLEDASYSANPLDAALRVIRLHSMQNYGDTSPPYPLLVVRPNGIESYAAARGAMQDWDDQFGYELVPADVKLAYAKPDDSLRQRVEMAIRDAAAKQHARHAIARREGGGGLDLHGVPERDRGSGRLPTLSAAELDRSGRANGFRSHRDPSQIARSPYTSGSPYIAGSQPNSLNGASNYGRIQNNAYDGNGYSGGDAASAARMWSDEMRQAAQEMRETAGERGASGSGLAGSGGSAEDGLANGKGGEADAAGGGAAAGAGDAGQSKKSASNVDPSTNAGDPQLGTSQAAGGAASQQPQHGTQSTSSQASSGQNPGSGSAPTSTTKGSNPASSADDVPAGGPPQSNISSTPSSPMVRRQGRDWALPPSTAGMHGNAIVRTIRVHCYADRFVLLAPASGGATEMFGFSNGDVERATLQLATAIRDRIERWGPALTGGRWEPRLDVIVMPRGEMRFHQLRTLMSGSGIEVTGRASP